MKRPPLPLLPLLAAVAAAAALAGCGGSSGSSTRRSTATSAAPGSSGAQTRPGGITSTPTRTVETVTLTQTTTTTTPAGGVFAAPARCTATDLGIHFVHARGAAGTSYLTFQFVNVTHDRCALQGYPGVSLVLASGAVDDITNERSPGPIRRVVIAPGGTAGFTVGAPGNAAPHCVNAVAFRFIPPNDTAYEQIHHPIEVCGGHVLVTPVGDVP